MWLKTSKNSQKNERGQTSLFFGIFGTVSKPEALDNTIIFRSHHRARRSAKNTKKTPSAAASRHHRCRTMASLSILLSIDAASAIRSFAREHRPAKPLPGETADDRWLPLGSQTIKGRGPAEYGGVGFGRPTPPHASHDLDGGGEAQR